MDKFWQSLSFMLPPGWAFPRRLGSVVMRVLKGFAGVLQKHENFVHDTVTDWIPGRTRNRLDEWEGAMGLPDPCFAETQTWQERHQNMIARLQGDLDLPYEDSSGDSIGAIRRYAARYGYEIEAWYNLPFRVGRNRVGQRLGRLNGRLYVRILHLRYPFRVGKNRVGNRLVTKTRDSEEILCILRRIVSQRFEISVIYY